MLNPNQGFKKFVMKLKQRYTVSWKTNLSNKYGGLFFRKSVLTRIFRGPNHSLMAFAFCVVQCTVNKQDISMESLNGQ